MMHSMDDDDVSLHSLDLSLVGSPQEHDRQDDSPAILSRKEQIATANNFFSRNNVQAAAKNIQVKVGPVKVHHSARGLDPPLPLLDPPEEYKPTAIMVPRPRHPPRRYQGPERKLSPRPSRQLSCNECGSNPSLASRDDDSAIRSFGSVHSSGAGTGSASAISHRSHGSTRPDIHAKIDAFNTKRRALREITCSASSSLNDNNDTNLAPPSEYNSEPLTLSLQSQSLSALTWSSPYSPASVISIAPTSVSVENKYDSPFPSENINAATPDTSTISVTFPGKPLHVATDESADSRSFMKKERLEFQKRAEQSSVLVGGGAPSSNNKKVTFEEDCMNVANIGMDESAFSVSEKNEQCSGVAVKESFRGPPSASDTSSAAFVTTRKSGTVTSFPKKSDIDSHPTKELAVKILSEKILEGYTMTHSHCSNCGMALLCRDATANNSITFNSDGSINMESLMRHGPKEECVFCPVQSLRKSISRGVGKRVMAAKLLAGAGVATNGRSLCDNCQSPTLFNKAGVKIDCPACPVLDAACVEIVREQGRGGTVQEFRICIDCGSPEIQQQGGAIKCMVCYAMKQELGEEQPSAVRLFKAPGRTSAAASITPPLPIRSISNNLPVLPQLSKLDVTECSSPTAETATVSVTSEDRRLTTEGPIITSQTLGPAKSASAPNPGPVVGTPSRMAEGHSVDGFAKSLSQAPSFTSQPPDLTNSPSILSKGTPIGSHSSIKSNGHHPHLTKNPSSNIACDSSVKSNKHHPIDIENIKELSKDDLVLLRDQIQAELAKAENSQELLERKISGYQPIEKFKSPCSPILDKDIVNNPSIKSGDSPPHLLAIAEQAKPHPMAVAEQAKLKDQLNATANNSLTVSSDNNPPNLTSLQDQLEFEIIKARKSQSMLENSLQHNSNASISSTKSKQNKIEPDKTKNPTTASTKSREDLRAELEKIEQSQFALEKIIEDAATTEDAEPSFLSDGNVDDVLAATIPQMNQSYSISQQEVDATGNLKEYIPPPSYLNFGPNIPSVVVVYHIPEEGDPSVAAQSHHLNNLKRSERYHRRVNSSIFNCCGNSAVNKRPNHKLDTGYDFDTIGTDDDYTVDYTLNTMDESRLGHLTVGHEEHRYQVNGEAGEMGRDNTEIRSCAVPQSFVGKLLVLLFGCGNGEGDDAYSMASRRGILIERHQQLQPYYEDKAIDHKQPTRQKQSSSSRQFCRDDPEEHYMSNLSLGEGSYFGSMRHNGGDDILKPQNRHSSSSGTWGMHCHDNYLLKDSERRDSDLIPEEQLDHTDDHSSSPPNAPGWGSINNSQNGGTDFGSMCRISSHGNQQAPTYSSRPKSSPQDPPVNTRPHPMPILHPRRSSADCSSVQSDLTDYSSSVRPRRSAFSSLSSRRGRKMMLQHQHQLRAFAKEGTSAEDVGGIGGRYLPVQEINPLCSLSMDGSHQY